VAIADNGHEIESEHRQNRNADTGCEHTKLFRL
jgi:hypothetical protein